VINVISNYLLVLFLTNPQPKNATASLDEAAFLTPVNAPQVEVTAHL
jgi:hypothetical protein